MEPGVSPSPPAGGFGRARRTKVSNSNNPIMNKKIPRRWRETFFIHVAGLGVEPSL